MPDKNARLGNEATRRKGHLVETGKRESRSFWSTTNHWGVGTVSRFGGGRANGRGPGG